MLHCFKVNTLIIFYNLFIIILWPSYNFLTSLPSAISGTLNKFSLLHHSVYCSFWASVYPFVYTDCYESPIKETKIPSSNTFKQNNVHYDVISKLIPFLDTNDFHPSHYQMYKKQNWNLLHFYYVWEKLKLLSSYNKKEDSITFCQRAEK